MSGQDSHFFDVIKAAEAEGWTTERTSKNHYKLNPPNGGRAVFTSGTPSDWRAFQDFLRKMRRAGFEWRKGRGTIKR